MKTNADNIIFTPNDVDLAYSPIRTQLKQETYVLGAFNPGMTRLPNGNLLLMIRIAESLKAPVKDGKYSVIRWSKKHGYILDDIPLEYLDRSEPRKYAYKGNISKTYCLTSSSWLLPVELNAEGEKVIQIHYDKIIEPFEDYQEYGIEDPRITKIEEKYYMTACAVSSSRHSTILYSSEDGLNYNLIGIILDHQNKDMVLFPEKINGFYYALTRPIGDHYFFSNTTDTTLPGPAIYMSRSPDLLHWKPVENFSIRLKKDTMISSRIGAGAPPIKTNSGWLILFHGVEPSNNIGVYRTFKCILDLNEPYKILSINYNDPVLESVSNLTDTQNLKKYLEDVVFTTGIEELNDNFIIASGELDLCCRISSINKKEINGNN